MGDQKLQNPNFIGSDHVSARGQTSDPQWATFAIGQCGKCHFTQSFTFVDAITALRDTSGRSLIHKPPLEDGRPDPRYEDIPCGGVFKLYRDLRLDG